MKVLFRSLPFECGFGCGLHFAAVVHILLLVIFRRIAYLKPSTVTSPHHQLIFLQSQLWGQQVYRRLSARCGPQRSFYRTLSGRVAGTSPACCSCFSVLLLFHYRYVRREGSRSCLQRYEHIFARTIPTADQLRLKRKGKLRQQKKPMFFQPRFQQFLLISDL